MESKFRIRDSGRVARFIALVVLVLVVGYFPSMFLATLSHLSCAILSENFTTLDPYYEIDDVSLQASRIGFIGSQALILYLVFVRFNLFREDLESRTKSALRCQVDD
jgi:hypothetical protein